MEIERIKTALDFLKNEQSFSVGDLRLESEKNCIIVNGWTQYSNILYLTKRQAPKELDEINILFDRMIDTSAELKYFADDKVKIYNLNFDDFGKCSIIICSEKDGSIKWEMDLGNGSYYYSRTYIY